MEKVYNLGACSQIKCWLSGLEFTKHSSEKQTGEILIWLCAVFLSLFDRQLVLDILEYLPCYTVQLLVSKN